ncbi:hypothetical protein M8J75_006747 [Diaphorina citri]|nr:hypothetical protein M8J75_006747 [Diaphorina citri]
MPICSSIKYHHITQANQSKLSKPNRKTNDLTLTTSIYHTEVMGRKCFESTVSPVISLSLVSDSLVSRPTPSIISLVKLAFDSTIYPTVKHMARLRVSHIKKDEATPTNAKSPAFHPRNLLSHIILFAKWNKYFSC